MTPLDIAVASLALWRVASLFTRERGPGDVFLHLRAAHGITHNEQGEPDTWSETYMSALMTCVWCFSMLAAIPYVALWSVMPVAMWWCSLPFALSALAIVVDRGIRGTR